MTGHSYKQLHHSFRMAPNTVASIVERTLVALWKVLQPIHLKGNLKEADFLKIAKDFYEKTGMPHCIGSLDG